MITCTTMETRAEREESEESVRERGGGSPGWRGSAALSRVEQNAMSVPTVRPSTVNIFSTANPGDVFRRLGLSGRTNSGAEEPVAVEAPVLSGSRRPFVPLCKFGARPGGPRRRPAIFPRTAARTRTDDCEKLTEQVSLPLVTPSNEALNANG